MSYPLTSVEEQLKQAVDDFSAAITDELMEAQADLQVGLGWFRLARMTGSPTTDELDLIEEKLTLSLARLHGMMTGLGRPMYSPSTKDKP